MRLRLLAERWLAKAGNDPDEYEDAYRVAYPEDGAARIAVADGASDSAFAREWAGELAEAFVAGPPEWSGLTEDALNAWLAAPRERWHGLVPWDRIPWHGEAKARAGALATLIGLTLDAAPGEPSRLRWQALAVGDACLFIVRGGGLTVSFPLDDAAEFDTTPALLCGNPDNAAGAWPGVRALGGECEAGDVFIVASDAIAAWLLARAADGERPWDDLAALDDADWEAWVGEQRGAGLMRNDDTTLVAIEVADDADADGAA